MQALSTQKNGNASSNSSISADDVHEQKIGDSLICETAPSTIEQAATAMSPSSSSSCGNQSVENCNFSQQHQLNFNNNPPTTVAINNNNNCDMVKNNNNLAHVAAPMEITNDVEGPSSAMIDQQNSLLRGANIGEI